jgi:hypothetical protein
MSLPHNKNFVTIILVCVEEVQKNLQRQIPTWYERDTNKVAVNSCCLFDDKPAFFYKMFVYVLFVS